MQITKVLVIWARYWFFFLLLLDLQGKVAIIKSVWIHNSFWIWFFFFNILIWLPWRTKIKSVLNKLKVYKKNSLQHFYFFFGCLFLFCYCLVRYWSIGKNKSAKGSYELIIVMLLWCVRQKALLPRNSKFSLFVQEGGHFFLNSWASLVA